MNNIETYSGMAEGHIKVYRRYADGSQKLVADKHNVITYSAADILAKVLGGDTSFMPSRIGFIYGDTAKPFTNPDSPSTRLQKWSSLEEVCRQVPSGKAGNIIVCTLGAPVYSVIGDSAYYSNNAVTVNAMSDKDAPRAFSGSNYAGAPVTGMKYYQVVLLARTFVPGSSTPIYTPYAIAQITDTADGIAIEDNTEFVVYWSMCFK